MTLMFMIQHLVRNELICLTMLSATQTRVQVLVEASRVRRSCVFSRFMCINAVDRSLAGHNNPTAVPKRDRRTVWVCSLSGFCAKGAMVTVTQ